MKLLWLPCLLLVSCSVTRPVEDEPQPGPSPQPTPVATTKGVETIADLKFAQPGGVELLMDLHLPHGIDNPPLVMVIHGGGWKAGDRKSSKLDWITREGYALANIEYRMSQEAVFPAQIHDCKGALRWLRAHQEEYGYDASRVVALGLSAGGHLACLMGTSSGNQTLEGNTAGHLDESSKIQGVINYFGPSDFIQRSKSQPDITDNPNGIVYQLLGGSVSSNPDAGDAPMLILHGDQDRQVLPDQARRLLEVCREKQLDAHLHIENGKGHGWNQPTRNEKKLVLGFLEKHLR